MAVSNTSTQRKILASIESLLRRKRWTWGQLAGEVGIAKSYISQLKTQTNRLNIETLEKIANALEVPVSYLLPRPPIEADDRKFVLTFLGLPEDISDQKLTKITEINRYLSDRSLEQLDGLLTLLSPPSYSEIGSEGLTPYAKVAEEREKYSRSKDS